MFVWLQEVVVRHLKRQIVAVSNEFRVFGQSFCEVLECYMHGEDAGIDTAVAGYLIADNGASMINQMYPFTPRIFM